MNIPLQHCSLEFKINRRSKKLYRVKNNNQKKQSQGGDEGL